MRIIARGLLALTMISSTLLAGASPSFAAGKPLKEEFTNAGFATLPDIDCGTFTLHEDLVSEKVTITTYFDKDGAAVKKVFHIDFVGILTRSDTGKTFRDHVAGLDLLDPITNELLESKGVKLNLHSPGEGNFAKYAGHKIYDGGTLVFNGGPRNPDFVTDPFESLCPLVP
jgi:hypothetical protein